MIWFEGIDSWAQSRDQSPAPIFSPPKWRLVSGSKLDRSIAPTNPSQERRSWNWQLLQSMGHHPKTTCNQPYFTGWRTSYMYIYHLTWNNWHTHITCNSTKHLGCTYKNHHGTLKKRLEMSFPALHREFSGSFLLFQEVKSLLIQSIYIYIYNMYTYMYIYIYVCVCMYNICNLMNLHI